MAGFPEASRVVSQEVHQKEGRKSATSLTMKHLQFQENHRTGLKEKTVVIAERDEWDIPKYGHIFESFSFFFHFLFILTQGLFPIAFREKG